MLIKKYQESWADDFVKIKEVILDAFSGIDVRIEHVGSTSVRNLAAKPIIDMDMVFDSAVNFEDLKTGLAALGYYHNGDQGIKDREAFKRQESAEKHAVLDFIDHHLYVCPAYSEELKRHLAFRDYLREHSEARREYENIKFQIAAETDQDKQAYSLLKETRARDFIESILEKAEKENLK